MVVGAVLVAFFIYSSRYLMVSTQVSRVKEEHRILTRALQNYQADYGTFPDNKNGLHALYGPIAYIVRVPKDPFSQGEPQEYLYIASPGGGYRWLLISDGPDGDCDLLEALGMNRRQLSVVFGEKEDEPNTLSLPAERISQVLNLVTYDPTNGLISGGDIITVGR